ncbi:alpha/beta hydrolase, partial [Nocardia wallacei]|uniref:alpha/beta hydrolase n=1 Tax=Nocardia wallacei TaxID=480035 RepID=UPI0024550FB4
MFDVIGALYGAGTRPAPEDDLDALNRFPEHVVAAAELDAARIIDGASWARLADDHLVSGRDGDWDPELMRSLRALPSQAAEFAATGTASDRAFGEMARRYIPEAYRAALYFLTYTRDTEQATALLRDLDYAVAAAVERLGSATPATNAGLSLFRLRVDIHQAIATAGGAAASAMRSTARHGLAENPALPRLMQRITDALGNLARHGDETPRQLRPSYTTHRITSEDLLDDDDERPPTVRSRAIGVHGGSLVEANGPELEPLRTEQLDVSFMMDRWGRMMVGNDHESLLRLMAVMGDELAGWGTLATDDNGRPYGRVRPYRAREIFDPMGTAQLRDALTRGGLHLDDNNFDNESRGDLWRGDPPPLSSLFGLNPVGFQGSIEAVFSGYAGQYWVKPVRDGIRLSPNEIRVPLTLAPLRREPGHIEVVAHREGNRTIVGYRNPAPGAEPTQVARVFAELHQRMTRWVAESENVEWRPDTAETVHTFARHTSDSIPPSNGPGLVGSRPSDDETPLPTWQGVDPVLVAAELTAKWTRLERIVGFDHPGADPEALREIARAIDDLYSRYPHINIREVRLVEPSELPNERAGAHTDPTTYRDGERGSIIKVNVHRVLDSDRYREMRERLVSSGVHRRGSEIRPFYRLIQHEGGHALDQVRPYTHLIMAALLDTYLNHTGRELPFLTWLDTGPEKLTGYSYLSNAPGRRNVRPSEAGAEAFWAGEAEPLSPHSPLGSIYQLAGGRKSIDYQPLEFARNMMRTYWPTPEPGVSVEEIFLDIGSNRFRVVCERSTPDAPWRIAAATGVFPEHDALARALSHLRAESPAELGTRIARALGSDAAPPNPFWILAEPGMSGNREVEPGYWGHYGAAGVLVRHVGSDGVERFLICTSKDGLSQGNWQFPDGMLRSREAPAQGAARELHEKLGADAGYLAGLAHKGTHVISGPRGWKYHVLVADAPERFDPVGKKSAQARWVSRDELAAMAARGELHSALARHLPRVLGLFDPEADASTTPPIAESTAVPGARPEGFRHEPAIRPLDRAMFDDYVRLEEFRKASAGHPSRTAEMIRRTNEFSARYPQARELAVEGQLLQHGTILENLNQLADDLGMRSADLRAELTAELTDLVEGKPLAIRIRREALFGLLADGRFKTQFEGQLGGGRAGEVARMEDRWFGNPEDMDPRLRPIYGLVLVDGERPAGLSDAATSARLPDIRATLYTEKAATYGRIEVVLKDAVRERATFCVGDSLVYSGSQADGKRARTIPSPLLDPQPESFGVVPLSAKKIVVDDQPLRGTNRDYSGALFRRHQFVESHIHGGVTLADIDHINLPESPDSELRAALDAAGIPWRVLDSQAIARSGDTEAIARERLRLEEDLAVVQSRAYDLRRELDAARRPDTPRQVLAQIENVRVELRNVEAMRDRVLEMLAPLSAEQIRPGGRVGARPSEGPGDGGLIDGLSLSFTETAIVRQVRSGATDMEIATTLGISERDVRASVAGVRRKIRSQRAQLVAAGPLVDLSTASESELLRAAMYAALIGADQPDPRQLIAEASAEQLKRVVQGSVSEARLALRPRRGRPGDVFRSPTPLAARRAMNTLAAEHNRSQAVLATALAEASPADLRAALDELDPAERRILTSRFGSATAPADFEPEDSVRSLRAIDIVRQVATSIATRAGTSAVDESNELLTAVQHTNYATAQTFTTNECLDAVVEWMDRQARSQADVVPEHHRPSLPVDHGFDDDQRRAADAALRAGGFRNADELRRWGNRLHAEFAQRRATENGEWWDSLRDPDRPGELSSTQRALIQVYPHQIGNADGLPAGIRDHANRLSVRRELDEFLARRPDGTGMLEWSRTGLSFAEKNRLSNLVHIRNHLQELDRQAAEMPGSPPVHLLSYDSTAFRGKGKAVVALGNVDTAHTVNWHVPGTNTTSASLAYQFKSMRNLYQETRKVDPSLELASIIWIGYDAPTGPVNTGFVKAAFRRRAKIGGDRLVCDITAFHATRRRAGTATPDRLVNRIYGHSYGSVTTCYAGRAGRLAGLIGSVILSGSPGAGPLHHAEDFGIGAHNVYVLASWRDPVTMFGADEPGAGSRYHRGLGLGVDPATEAFGGERLGAEFPNSPDFAGVEDVHQGYLHYDPATGQPNEALFHSAYITAGRADTLTRVPRRRAGRVPFRPTDSERDRYADLGSESVPNTENSGHATDPDGLIGSRPHDDRQPPTPWSRRRTAADPSARLAVAHRLTERRAELLWALSALLAPHGVVPAELLRTGSPTWETWFARHQQVRGDLVAMLEIDRGTAVDDEWIRHVLAEWRDHEVATPEILSTGEEFERSLPVTRLVDDIQRLDNWAQAVKAVEAELARPDRPAAARQRLEEHARDLYSLGTAVTENERASFTPSHREIMSAARRHRLSTLDSWHGMALLHARLRYLVAAVQDPDNEISVPVDIEELREWAAQANAAVERYDTTHLLNTDLDVTLDLVNRVLTGVPAAAGGTAWRLSESPASALFEERLAAVRADVATRRQRRVVALLNGPSGEFDYDIAAHDDIDAGAYYRMWSDELLSALPDQPGERSERLDATIRLIGETSRARRQLGRIDTVTAAIDEAGHRMTLGRKMLIRQMGEHLEKYPLDRRMERGELEPDLATILAAVRVCEAALPGDDWSEATPAQVRRRVDRLRSDDESAQVVHQAERYLSLRLLLEAFDDETWWRHWLYELVAHGPALERLTGGRRAAEATRTSAYARLRELAASGEIDLSRWRTVPELREALHRRLKQDLRGLGSMLGTNTPEPLRRLLEAPADTAPPDSVRAAVIEIFPLLTALQPHDIAVRDHADRCLLLSTMVDAAEQIGDRTAEIDRFDADLDDWLDAVLDTVGRAGGRGITPDDSDPDGLIGSRPSAYDSGAATADLVERSGPGDPGPVLDFAPAGLIGARPSSREVATAIGQLPQRPGAADPDLILDFRPGDEKQLAAAANALADLLRAHDWRVPAHPAAASDLVRRAGREALAFLDRSFRTLRRELGVPDHLDLSSTDAARLTVRLSTASDGARSLHLSLECDQTRPVYAPYSDSTPWPAPLHNDREVGPEVRTAVATATRSGVEPWGEVWADFTEPPADSRPPESPPPVTPREAKARIVRALYEDLHLRLDGWEDPEIPPEAVAVLADRARVLIAEFGRRRLRGIRIEPNKVNGVTFNEGSVDPTGFNHHTTIVMDKQYLLQVLIIDDLPALRAQADHHEAINFWGRSDDPLGGILDHEFRHALDAATGYRLSALSEQLLPLIHADLVDRGLLPRDLHFRSWFDLLPGYGRNVQPVDGVSLVAVESFAEGGRAGSADPSLPATHPARALDWLTRRYLDGTVPDSVQEVFQDWLTDHHDLTPDAPGTYPSDPAVPEHPLAHPAPTAMRPDDPGLARQIRGTREAAGRALETLGDTGDPTRRDAIGEALNRFEAAARDLSLERGLRAEVAAEYDRAAAADRLTEELVKRRDHHTARVVRHENRMRSAVAELAVIIGAPALSDPAQVEDDPVDNDNDAGHWHGRLDADGPTGSIGSRPGEDRSRSEFSPGMSAAETRAAVAGALSDATRAPAEIPPQLTNIAALLVNYALQAAGGDSVRLSSTTTRSASGYAVRGQVEGLRIPEPRGVLADAWGGENFGEFEWTDPGDGSRPSWSVRLWGDRKRFKRLSAALPPQLADLIPGAAAPQTISPISEAVQVAASRKGVGRGGTLALEARDGRLRVRVNEGVVPLIGVPDKYAQTIGKSGPQGRFGSRPHENGSHDGPFDPTRLDGRIGSRPQDEVPELVRTEPLRGRLGLKKDLLTFEYRAQRVRFQVVRETYSNTAEAVVEWTEALIGQTLEAPIKLVTVEPPEYRVLYRDHEPERWGRGDPRAPDALGVFEAITGKRSPFADVFVRRAGGRALWRDHHLRGQVVVDMAERLSMLAATLSGQAIPDSILSIMLDTIDTAFLGLSEIAAHADRPARMAGLDDETQAKVRLVETFKLRHPYVEVTGFDTPYASKQAVEEILGKLDELLHKYRYTPAYRKLRTNIRALRIDFLLRSRAIASPRYDEETNTVDGSELTFNLRYAADPDKTIAASDRETRDRIHPGSGHPYADDALHEFAHAIDDATGRELSRDLPFVLREAHAKLQRLGVYESYEEWLGQLPLHAYATPTMGERARKEALAVGFVDAEINGTFVGTPQWVIHEYVTNLEPPRIHWNLRLGDPAHPAPTGSIGSRPSENSPGDARRRDRMTEPGTDGTIDRRTAGPADGNEPADPDTPPGEWFAELVDEGLAAGVVRTEPLPGAPGVRLELVTFDNGYQVVRETYENVDSATDQWLHSMMGAAMGAPVAETCLRPDDFTVLYRELVPGGPADTVLPQSTARAYDLGLVHEDLNARQREMAAMFGPVDTRHLRSAAADLLGLFDAATGTRRSTRHWNIDPDDAVRAGRGAIADEEGGPSPFAAKFVRHADGATVWRDHTLPRRDITALRERVSYVGELVEHRLAGLSQDGRDRLHRVHARVLAELARAERHAVHTSEETAHVSGLDADAQAKARLVENFALNHPYFEIAGFDHPLLPVESAREILETLDELLSKYRYTPGFRRLMINIRGLRIDFMDHPDVNAETVAAGRGRTRGVALNQRPAGAPHQALAGDI